MEEKHYNEDDHGWKEEFLKNLTSVFSNNFTFSFGRNDFLVENFPLYRKNNIFKRRRKRKS